MAGRPARRLTKNSSKQYSPLPHISIPALTFISSFSPHPEVADLTLLGTKTTQKPRGHWTMEGSKNVKMFFDEYAKVHNKDPMDPKTWYSVQLKDILDMPVCFLFYSLFFVLFCVALFCFVLFFFFLSFFRSFFLSFFLSLFLSLFLSIF